MTTAERVKELRKSKGWTLQKLADKCGVTKQSVHLWESGGQGISRQNLEMLCDIFNVQMDYLLCKQDISVRFFDHRGIVYYRPLQEVIIRATVFNMLHAECKKGCRIYKFRGRIEWLQD